jgi:pimeloyl-ACP methyl ester carboxylesterase
VADAIGLIERLELGPVDLVGQSMGGLHAFVIAARRPDLVRRLVVVEAWPSPDPIGRRRVRDWFTSWPIPFADAESARTFLGGEAAWADEWLSGMDWCPDGLRPLFDLAAVLAVLDEPPRDWWKEWERVRCPTLIVAGEHGSIPHADLQDMVRRLPGTKVSVVPEAGHDLHVERPDAWRLAVEPFLTAQESAGAAWRSGAQQGAVQDDLDGDGRCRRVFGGDPKNPRRAEVIRGIFGNL